MPQFLSIADILAQLRLRKPDAILRAIATGELRAVNVGAGKIRPTWRVSPEDFAAWLERRAARRMPEVKRSQRKISKPEVEYV